MSGPRRRLRVLAVDDEPPALDELGYLLGRSAAIATWEDGHPARIDTRVGASA